MSRGDQPTTPGQELTEHPSADELVDYAGRTLTSSVNARIQRHVEGCDECLSLVRDLAEYPALDPPGEAYAVSEEELRSTLGALRATLIATTGPAANADDTPSAEWSEPMAPADQGFAKPQSLAAPRPTQTTEYQERSSRRAKTHTETFWPGWATYGPLLAAALILASLGGVWHYAGTSLRLESQIASLENDLQELENGNRSPWTNVKIAQLLPADDPVRSQQALSVPLSETLVVVVVPLIEPLPQGEYVAEIRKPDGETELRIPGLEPQSIGLTFGLRPKDLPPGRYLLWIVRDGVEVLPTPFELLVSS